MKTAFLVAAIAILSVASAEDNSFDERCLRVCPNEDFSPFCASNGQIYRLYRSKCVMEAANCDAGYKHKNLWVESPKRMCDCPKTYSPVCGFDGRTYKIFNNACLLQHQEYEHKYNQWTQKSMDLCLNQIKCMKACPSEYRPVCGYDGINFVTFGNPCNMEVKNCLNQNRWITLRKGECPASNMN